MAWNGVGLVLVELKKLEDARNAYGRAIQAKPNYAEAHYNLSFVLSNLGDYEGALKATKRALEIDPYYVPQKFELAIDLEFEDPEFTIVPDLGGDKRTDGSVEEFALDTRRARFAVHRARAGRAAAARRRRPPERPTPRPPTICRRACSIARRRRRAECSRAAATRSKA